MVKFNGARGFHWGGTLVSPCPARLRRAKKAALSEPRNNIDIYGDRFRDAKPGAQCQAQCHSATDLELRA
jgi:hypothetical protein